MAVDQGDYVLALDAEAKLEQLGERSAELNYKSASCCSSPTCRKTRRAPIAGRRKRNRSSPKRCSTWATRWKLWGRKKKLAPTGRQAVQAKPELAEKYF